MTQGKGKLCPECGRNTLHKAGGNMYRCSKCGYTVEATTLVKVKQPKMPKTRTHVKTPHTAIAETIQIGVEDRIRANRVVKLLGLTDYMSQTLEALLCFKTPVSVYELAQVTKGKVARTKLYNSLIDLNRAKLVCMIKGEDMGIEKPSVYEWWDEKKQRRFLAQHLPVTEVYTANIDGIAEALLRKIADVEYEKQGLMDKITSMKKAYYQITTEEDGKYEADWDPERGKYR